MDLRVAKISEAAEVEGADRLLKLTVELSDGQTRTVFAGIRGHYKPEEITGRNVVVVANLKPRKMRFGVSEGMALAAEADGKLFLLDAVNAPPGAKVS